MNKIINALTIDVEDAINQAMRNFFKVDMKPTLRVYNNTNRILDLLSQYNIKGTFFILGETARTFPSLVKDISRRGHELGVHGYSHIRYYHLSRQRISEEVRTTKQLIEDISGIEVIGHRAPEFSINNKMNYVFDILLDAGFKYDSSIFPISNVRYGWPGFTKEIVWMNTDSNRKIVEVPLSVVNVFCKTIPVCGGGYLRTYPYFITDLAFSKINNKRPVIVYLHPYEIDTPPFEQFYMDRIKKSSLHNRLLFKKQWYKRHTVLPKLHKMLTKYEFTTIKNVINDRLGADF